jgi:peptide/nickel transport system substrate-binding protein
MMWSRRNAQSGKHERQALSRRSTGALVTVVLSAVAISFAIATQSSAGTNRVGATRVVKFALPPSSPPTAIFPVLSAAQYSNVNLNQFTKLMFLPLYWVGKGNTVLALDSQRSIANPPVWSNNGRTVTVSLKHYMWSNGTPVTARDVEFWNNLVKANKTEYGGYVPGGYPDNIVKTTIVNPSTIRFQLNRVYNHTWFLFNELSQISPLPAAWDKTSASGRAGQADLTPVGAKAVFNDLETQTKDLATYATNPTWQIVDGPWRLKSFDTTGRADFVPNTKFSGPIKPRISEFIEVPYTSATAEINDIRSGQGPDIGYVPLTDLKQIGSLKSHGYQVAPWVDWNMNFMAINFNNPTLGPLFKQLYIRQALQYVMNQPLLVKAAYGGFAWPDYGPVPPKPDNSFVSSYARNNPYPFSTAAASTLLDHHGWKVTGGTRQCVNPGTGPSQCGAGIKSGAKLSFNLLFASENPPLKAAMQEYQSAAGQAGIAINLSEAPILTVFGDISPCHGAKCTWQIANYGIGWTYFPDYYPTGDFNFLTGAGSNFGGYSDPTADKLIRQTLYATPATAQAALDKYQNYLAKNLPWIWQPNYHYQVSLIKSNLKGATPQSPTLIIDPTTMYFSGK